MLVSHCERPKQQAAAKKRIFIRNAHWDSRKIVSYFVTAPLISHVHVSYVQPLEMAVESAACGQE